MFSRLSVPGFARIMLSVLICTFSGVSIARAATWTARAEPTRLVNGAPVLFQIKPPQHLQSLTGSWLGHQLTFSYDAATKTWFTLAGVPLETAPGAYSLELTGERGGGKNLAAI